MRDEDKLRLERYYQTERLREDAFYIRELTLPEILGLVAVGLYTAYMLIL